MILMRYEIRLRKIVKPEVFVKIVFILAFTNIFTFILLNLLLLAQNVLYLVSYQKALKERQDYIKGPKRTTFIKNHKI